MLPDNFKYALLKIARSTIYPELLTLRDKTGVCPRRCLTDARFTEGEEVVLITREQFDALVDFWNEHT